MTKIEKTLKTLILELESLLPALKYLPIGPDTRAMTIIKIPFDGIYHEKTPREIEEIWDHHEDERLRR